MMNMDRQWLGHEMRDDGMVRTTELASLKNIEYGTNLSPVL